MKVSDHIEPPRIGLIGPKDRAVHYESGSRYAVTLCGMESNLRAHREHDDDCPDWLYADSVCLDCVAVAAGLLRWWHPRGELPDWAEETSP